MLALRRSALNDLQIILSRSLKIKAHKMSNHIHKETMRYIDGYAKIKVLSDILLKVRATDEHRYPNADVLVAELHGGLAKNCNIEMSVRVSDDLKDINVNVGQLEDDDKYHCVLTVPVKAALNIEGKKAVFVEQMLGEELQVLATNDIKTRDIRCDIVSLKSTSGNINCAGVLVGKRTSLETMEKNSIQLDRLQGDKLKCKTEAGEIHTNCCYVEKSSFKTESGSLNLKNVHKCSKVAIKNPEGSLRMTGFNGNIHVKSYGRNLNIQLSELQGENLIVAENAEMATINISENIEKSTKLDLMSKTIKLTESLSHLQSHLGEQSKCFHYEPSNCECHLTVRSSNGNLQFGKLSWAEMMAKNFEKKRLS